MSSQGSGLGRAVASVLRVGTMAAAAVTAAGYLLALLSPASGPGARPWTDLIVAGGPDTLIAVGLLGLSLIPVLALAVAASVLWRHGERSRASIGGGVLLLLVASFVVAAAIGGSS